MGETVSDRLSALFDERWLARQRIESELETDGRWLAEIPEMPGAMAYGATRDEAVEAVKKLALAIKVERLKADPVWQALMEAPLGEPLSEEEEAGLAEVEAEIRAGRPSIPHAEVHAALLQRIPVETKQELDGRWRAHVTDMPEVFTYGATREEADQSVRELAYRMAAEAP